MAFCSNCGKELAIDAKFCSVCGTPVSKAAASQRTTVYEGEIHKCPNCGEVLSAFNACCPACGYEIRGSQAVSSVKELANKLEGIEKTREHSKAHSLIGKLYGSDGQLGKTDEQKISLIRSFSIPNTKEDIFEFMILAASNIDLKLYGLGNKGVLTASQQAVSDAWLAKFEQAYQKAQITFGMAPEFLNISKIYDDKMKALKKKRLEIPLLIAGLLAIIFLPLLFALVFK